MRVQSVNIAALKHIEVRGKQVPTGIFKEPARGPQTVDVDGFRDDVRVEARRLGESDHAVYAYPLEHYAHWRSHLRREELPPGFFGENLTVTGLLETDVRIGDVLRCGTTTLQVSHPRIPCRKLDARVGQSFKRRFVESRRVGFYLRVLTPGEISAGDAIVRVESDPRSPTVDEFIRLSHFDYWDSAGLEYLLRAKDLSERWRETLSDKLARARKAVGWFGLRELEVFERREEGDNAVSLSLRCAKHHPLPVFRPGQDLTLSIRPSPDASLQRRGAALSGNPAETDFYRITMYCGAEDVSERDNHDPLAEYLAGIDAGDTLRATEPQGWFTTESLSEIPCDQLLFVSEDIGIASIISMLHQWSLEYAHIPAVLLQVGSCSRFRALRAEAASIGTTAEHLTILEGVGVPELFDSRLSDEALVFAAARHDTVTELQNACYSEGLDHTRIRIKRVCGAPTKRDGERNG